jgi:sec-independent protein translocase protein TatA
MVSGWQIVVILVVILLLFGGKKIPELAKGLGEGIKSFKDAVKDGEGESPKGGTEIKGELKGEVADKSETNSQVKTGKGSNA